MRWSSAVCYAMALLGATLLEPLPAASQLAQLANNGAAWSLIAVQNVTSGSSSLQFTGANWSTNYNTLFLNCEGLLVSAAGAGIGANVGEGTGASFAWETGAHYTVTGAATTASNDVFNGNAGNYNTTLPVTMMFWIYNPGSSTAYKMIYDFEFGGLQTKSGETYAGQSWWNADTNPIAGFELVASGGTLSSGTCSLYGMN